MKYLDCIEMLEYGLKILKEGQRIQVSTNKMPELLMIVTGTSKKIGAEQSLMYKTTSNDLLQAIGVVQEMKSVKYLSDNMKQTLTDGLNSLKLEISKLAYDYYSTHDFEPTEEVIPIMRDVVKTYSLGGGEI